MGEDPSGLLQYTRPPPIEQLSMNEGDVSRRLPDEILERLWVMKSQERPLELPQWTARDPVVKKIATFAVEHPSSPLSCSPESSFITPPGSPTFPTVPTSKESNTPRTSPESGTDSMANLQQLRRSTLKTSGKASAQPIRKSQRQCQTKKAPLSKSSGIKKQVYKSTSRTRSLPGITRQTRSQGVTKFYALDHRNNIMSWR